jgi:hypothetical protein
MTKINLQQMMEKQMNAAAMSRCDCDIVDCEYREDVTLGYQAALTDLEAKIAMLVELVDDHDCFVGSTYFDSEDRKVTGCRKCDAVAEFTAGAVSKNGVEK